MNKFFIFIFEKQMILEEFLSLGYLGFFSFFFFFLIKSWPSKQMNLRHIHVGPMI